MMHHPGATDHNSDIFGVSGELNNGIKKEVLGKDAARIWINDDIKLHTFPQSLVSFTLKEDDYAHFHLCNSFWSY